jgi:hypothetical protein
VPLTFNQWAAGSNPVRGTRIKERRVGDVIGLVSLMIAMILFRIWLDRKMSGEKK